MYVGVPSIRQMLYKGYASDYVAKRLGSESDYKGLRRI
jgi:hypothetical protein